MKKLGVVFLTLGILLLGATISSAKDIYVNPAHAPDATHATTITGGLALAAATGDVIHVVPGTYVENVFVTKEVRIVSTAGKLRTFVFAPTAGSSAFIVTANNVAINGFTIRGGNTTGIGVGIQANNVRVVYCIVEYSSVGVSIIPPAANVSLLSNQIRYCTAVGATTYAGTGVLVSSTGAAVPNVIISANQIVDNDSFGILVDGPVVTPDFSGLRIGSNNLVNNGAADVASNYHNLNLAAIGFNNASGAITMNNNKIQAPFFGAISVSGGGPPTFSGTGNKLFSSCNKTAGGLATSLTLP